MINERRSKNEEGPEDWRYFNRTEPTCPNAYVWVPARRLSQEYPKQYFEPIEDEI